VTWGSQNPGPTITLHTGAVRLRTTWAFLTRSVRWGVAAREPVSGHEVVVRELLRPHIHVTILHLSLFLTCIIEAIVREFIPLFWWHVHINNKRIMPVCPFNSTTLLTQKIKSNTSNAVKWNICIMYAYYEPFKCINNSTQQERLLVSMQFTCLTHVN